MIEAEWNKLAALLENGWRGEMDDERSAAYFTLLRNFDAEEVGAAIQLLVENPNPFLPAVSEIVAEIRKASDPVLPAWTQAWMVIKQNLGGDKRESLAAMSAVHPFIGAFVEAEGFKTLCMTPFEDPEYGELRVKQLGERWAEFCERGVERVRRGRAIEAHTGESRGLPTRINAAAALGIEQRPELPSG